jgi:hypothetical protein
VVKEVLRLMATKFYDTFTGSKIYTEYQKALEQEEGLSSGGRII